MNKTDKRPCCGLTLLRAVLLVWVIALGIIMAHLFDPRPVIEDNSTIAAQVGDEIFVGRSYRKLRHCPTTEVRYFLVPVEHPDDNSYVIFPLGRGTPINANSGKEVHYSITFPIPDNIPSGTYRVRVSLVIDCGGFINHTPEFFSDPFELSVDRKRLGLLRKHGFLRKYGELK